MKTIRTTATASLFLERSTPTQGVYLVEFKNGTQAHFRARNEESAIKRFLDGVHKIAQ